MKTVAEKLAARQLRANTGAKPNASIRPYLDPILAGHPEVRASTVNCTAVVRNDQHGEQIRVYWRDWRRMVFRAAAAIRLAT